MRRWLLPLGLFVLISSVYAISGPGRIDTVDGQYRYDVARNIVQNGSPIITDSALPNTPIGRDGRRYFLGPTASLVAVPLVEIGNLIDKDRPQLHECLFSFTTAFIAALGSVLLFSIYVLLGVTRRRAVAWTLVAAFATLTWPVASSAFDQPQQATALLLAVWLGLVAARTGKPAHLFACGIAASVLVTYQDVYIALVPVILIACRSEGETLRAFLSSRKPLIYAAGAVLGLAVLLAFNYWRYGGPTPYTAFAPKVLDLKPSNSPPLLGNPLIGAAGLLLSPGKSIILFSPTILLAFAGVRGLFRTHRSFATAVILIVAVQFAMISCLKFFGGDWAWGPRYLTVTLPLTCIAFPFAQVKRSVVIALVSLSVVFQLAGLSVHHDRWYLEHKLEDTFWGTSAKVYFTESQLIDRFGEIATLSSQDHISSRRFSPNPYRSATYASFGNADRNDAPRWMRQFAIYFLPKPWPLWMPRLSDPPVSWKLGLILCALGILSGLALVVRGVRIEPKTTT